MLPTNLKHPETFFYPGETFKNALKSMAVMGPAMVVAFWPEFLLRKILVNRDKLTTGPDGGSYKQVYSDVKSARVAGSSILNGWKPYALYNASRLPLYRAWLFGWVTGELKNVLPQSTVNAHPWLVPGVSSVIMAGADLLFHPLLTITSRLQTHQPIPRSIPTLYSGGGIAGIRYTVVWAGFFYCTSAFDAARERYNWQLTPTQEIGLKTLSCAGVMSAAIRPLDYAMNLAQTTNEQFTLRSITRRILDIPLSQFPAKAIEFGIRATRAWPVAWLYMCCPAFSSSVTAYFRRTRTKSHRDSVDGTDSFPDGPSSTVQTSTSESGNYKNSVPTPNSLTKKTSSTSYVDKLISRAMEQLEIGR